MKQTAVDFLIYHIRQDTFVHSKSTKEWNGVFQQSKEMEKEQIKDAFVVHYTGTAEQYYNETFNSKEK